MNATNAEENGSVRSSFGECFIYIDFCSNQTNGRNNQHVRLCSDPITKKQKGILHREKVDMYFVFESEGTSSKVD